MFGKAQDLFSTFLHTVLPIRCLNCQTIIGDHGFCAPCWEQLPFLPKPSCTSCAMPLPDKTSHTLCGACLNEPPQFDCADSALVYDDFSRKLVLNLKNQDKTFVLNVITKLLWAAGHTILKDSQALVPVPLHWRKQWVRQFNQSALIAHYLSKWTHIPVLHALKRSRSTPSQGGLTSLEREKNVQGAFQGTLPALHLNHCTLIDDVLTTGSTLNECARSLKKLGVKKVSVLTVCRTINSGKKYVRY